jgi:hypothetical protein
MSKCKLSPASNPNPHPKPISLPCPRQAWIPIRTGRIRDGISPELEAFGRTVVGCDCSGRHARETLLLTADYLLKHEEATQFKDDFLTTHWFALQREAVGSESFVYACLELAACGNILQWGFDETSLDGQSTFNQWYLVRRAGGLGIITLECAGILPSSTAAETVEHVKKTWERGRACLDLVRAELGPELQDVLAPLTEGGLMLHRIFGLMHDTCSTANRVA